MKRLFAVFAGAILATGFALPANAAGTIDPYFNQVLADPTDPEINNAYARRAEDRGEHRKALATYERVLVHHPDNAEAIAGLMRMRRYLQPSVTQFQVELGGTYQSNARQFPSPGEVDDGSGFAAFRIFDERRLGSQRWRTQINTFGELFGRTDVLNNFDVDASVGPLFNLTPSVVVRPALFGAYSWLDGGTLFGEGGASLTFEGYLQGALQALEIRATWRGYADRWVSDDGAVIDIRGHFAANGLIDDADALVFKPRLRWSGVEASALGFAVPARFEPGKYTEFGTILDYYYPINEWLLAGPTFAIYGRWFEDPVVAGGSNRRDTYLAPGAAVIFRNIGVQNVDVRFDYKYEYQDSNDPTRDFDNHIAAGRFIARF